MKTHLTLIAAALTLVLAACGGGGSGSGSTANTSGSSSSGSSTNTSTQPTVPAGTTQTSPTYTAGSAQATMFTLINSYRSSCGFPTLQSNTLLDQAAQSHAQYMGLNGNQVTDTETKGNPGFTGVSGLDRAVALGWPSQIWVGADSAVFYSSPANTGAGYATQMVQAWTAGVYHQQVVTLPTSVVGIGFAQGNSNGYSYALGSVSEALNSTTMSNITTAADAPLTFPCQGLTGIAYSNSNEYPAPPSANASFGTPVSVVGNYTDTVSITSATMTDPTGNVINLAILNSSTDPNKLISTWEAVAYPISPLQPNTVYLVHITGQINSSSYTRSFTFTTGA